MINTAMAAKQDEFNEFTSKLAARCRTDGSVLVQLRNNTIVSVELYEDLEYDDEVGDYVESVHFTSGDHDYAWHLDGSSFKSFNYDIMMMGSNNLLSNRWGDYL
jgi:hypothetical protein